MTAPVLFSSKSEIWETPDSFFRRADLAFGPFDLDACALAENTKVPGNFITPQVDALRVSWVERGQNIWLNPPYGRDIGMWMKKAWEESEAGAKVVCLVHARTDTKWWHEWALRGQVYFVKGRLKFGNAKFSAPFPSCLVVFFPKEIRQILGLR